MSKGEKNSYKYENEIAFIRNFLKNELITGKEYRGFYKQKGIGEDDEVEYVEKKLSEICGDGDILDTILSLFLDDDEDSTNFYILKNKDKVLGIFMGEIIKDTLMSHYTCAAPNKKIGEMLGYYSILNANKKNSKVVTLKGSASGGIPAITDKDSAKSANIKNEKLIKYHKDRGADVDSKIFTYKLDNIVSNIRKLMKKERSPKKSSKKSPKISSKKSPKKSGKKSKKNRKN